METPLAAFDGGKQNGSRSGSASHASGIEREGEQHESVIPSWYMEGMLFFALAQTGLLLLTCLLIYDWGRKGEPHCLCAFTPL
jgi:hypothetical protein